MKRKPSFLPLRAFQAFLIQYPSPDTALASADLIVEAITENLPLKQKLFAEWDKVGGRKCLCEWF